MWFIDTQLWVFAQKIPTADTFSDDKELKHKKKLHDKAALFIKNAIESQIIAMSYHQLSEIFHALSFRGNKIDREKSALFCMELLQVNFIRWFSISQREFKQSLELSTKSGIHIWDYLCVLPLLTEIDCIYTCDSHFNHQTFQDLKKKILNPIDEWMVL